jgi:SAM-dependent methyltransferase
MGASCIACDNLATGIGTLAGLDGREYSALKCCDCGLAWADPLPALTEPCESIYDEEFYAPSIGNPTRVASERRVVNAMADFVERIVPRGAFLDVGCGEGIHMALMRERGWDVCGVEVSRFAAQHARRVHNLDVFHGALADANLRPESFALVQFRHVIEHLADPKSALERAAGLLQPGGVMRIDTPGGDFWRSGLGFVLRMVGNTFPSLSSKSYEPAQIRLSPPMHVFCFTEAALRELVGRCGLTTVKLIHTYHGDPNHYPDAAPTSLFGRVARALDVVSAKLNLGEVLVLYATRNKAGRPV